MPIYEYQCTNCHHEFDVLQKLNDERVKTCPQCAENAAIRLVSAAGFQLKGTGWYATDFKDKGKPEKKATGDAVAENHSTSKKTTENQPAVTSKKGEAE